MGHIKWQAPSNIALVKYWGKYGVQLPSNPSLSFSLKECTTTTEMRWSRLERNPNGSNKNVSFRYFFEGVENQSFNKKISLFLDTFAHHYPIVCDYQLEFFSSNSFPHSAGIASSASSMAALSLCLTSFLERIENKKQEDFFKHASYWARLGSGSACRSLYAGFTSWGDESEEFASEMKLKGINCYDLADDILIVDHSQKKTSSRQGHQLMNNHPYAQSRFQAARENFQILSNAIEQNDWQEFANTIKRESWQLHAMMMCSSDPFCLIRPHTLSVIENLEKFLAQEIPWTFTLDAGPNIHLIYPLEHRPFVHDVLTREICHFLHDGRFIADCAGKGPQKLSESEGLESS